MQKTTAYQAEDGTLFLTEEEARKHEYQLEAHAQREIAKDELAALLIHDTMSQRTTDWFLDFVLDRAGSFVSILKPLAAVSVDSEE